MVRFELGALEISDLAQQALDDHGVRPEVLFDRHRKGDWADAPEWCHKDNERAVRFDRASHAIRSHYVLDDGTEVLVITSPDRSRTRLQLASEYGTKQVSLRDGYAVWSSWYDGWNPLVEVEESVVRPLLEGLLPVERAIDVATGTGRHALFLAERGAEVLGLDDSPEMLRVARANARERGLVGVRFQQATLGTGRLPAPPESFDLAVCALALCHVPDLEDAVGECARLVRPGGHLVLSDFHPSAIDFGWHVGVPTPDAYLQLPNAHHTRDGYLDAVEAAGCRLLDIHDLGTDGAPYGEVTQEVIAERGWPPLCLVVAARKG